MKKATFAAAYAELRDSSHMLARTPDGVIELWETNGKLLTVVDKELNQFLTKLKELNPSTYMAAKSDLIRRITCNEGA